MIGIIDLSLLRNAPAEDAGEDNSAELWMRWPFPSGIFIPIRGLIWRWSGYGAKSRFDILPVVNRANVHKLEGIVTLRDVLDAYGVNRA